MTDWRKPSRSAGNGNCAEVAGLPDGTVGVRDSKDPDGPRLEFTIPEWLAFIGTLKALQAPQGFSSSI